MRRKRKVRRQVSWRVPMIVQIVLGGIAGVVIGQLIVWHVFGFDAFGTGPAAFRAEQAAREALPQLAAIPPIVPEEFR